MAKTKEKEERELIKKTCRVDLIHKSGQRFKVADIELVEFEPGPKTEQFADAAFKEARASLVRLMVPDYRLVVLEGEKEVAFGLDRWIKLRDYSDENQWPKKQRVPRRKAA